MGLKNKDNNKNMKGETSEISPDENAETVSESQQSVEEEVPVANVASDNELKIQEYIVMAQRIQAEFDNYRKRNADSIKTARIEGANEIILGILPIADAIERAGAMITDKSALEGVNLIRKQLEALLTKYGVSETGTVGDVFNPDIHNALMCVPDPENAGKVIEVLQKGYSRNGKIIRYAMVKVAE
ncbi:MAG: nucleotide exchange factor GrpE [Christensenellaceae bacterium]|jgi:molecular chaperone GrpE|nr:nucleotide exchange factor GrpE [Christensenellaceae bacterium]